MIDRLIEAACSLRALEQKPSTSLNKKSRRRLALLRIKPAAHSSTYSFVIALIPAR
jgi:hypothetical protein